MINAHSRFSASLAALVVMACAACSGGKTPASPTPAARVCEDPNARNSGQPLPCIYPVKSAVKVLSVSPPSGSNLRFSGRGAEVLVEWVYDPYIPGTVSVAGYLSVDCEEIVPSSRYGLSGATTGQQPLILSPRRKEWFRERGITRTNCIIAQIEVVDADLRLIEVVTREVVPWVFNLVD